MVFTEWGARVASFILWEAYDIFRLWYFPPVIRGYAEKTRLEFVLGSRESEGEFHRMITKVDKLAGSGYPQNLKKR